MDGDTIRIVRAFYGLNRRELAERLGCSDTYVSYLESGKRRITSAIEERLRSELGLTDEYIEELRDLSRSARRGTILGNISRRDY